LEVGSSQKKGGVGVKNLKIFKLDGRGEFVSKRTNEPDHWGSRKKTVGGTVSGNNESSEVNCQGGCWSENVS